MMMKKKMMTMMMTMRMMMMLHFFLFSQQACKPRSYDSIETLTHRLPWVKSRATSVAKNVKKKKIAKHKI